MCFFVLFFACLFLCLSVFETGFYVGLTSNLICRWEDPKLPRLLTPLPTYGTLGVTQHTQSNIRLSYFIVNTYKESTLNQRTKSLCENRKAECRDAKPLWNQPASRVLSSCPRTRAFLPIALFFNIAPTDSLARTRLTVQASEHSPQCLPGKDSITTTQRSESEGQRWPAWCHQPHSAVLLSQGEIYAPFLPREMPSHLWSPAHNLGWA